MNYILSILTGALTAIMILLNGLVGNSTGIYTSSVIIHLIGLVGIIIVLFATKSKLNGLKKVPFYLYTGGLVGILTVLFNNVSFAGLGVSLIIALSLLGQSIASLVIDHFGYFNVPVNRFNKKKLIGLSIISAGILLMILS